MYNQIEDLSEYVNINNIESQFDRLQDLSKNLSPTDMIILHLNVRGLKSNCNNLEVLISR